MNILRFSVVLFVSSHHVIASRCKDIESKAFCEHGCSANNQTIDSAILQLCPLSCGLCDVDEGKKAKPELMAVSPCAASFGGSAGQQTRKLATDVNNFAGKLFSAVYNAAGEEPKNQVFSPWSIVAALSMLTQGARNETLELLARKVFSETFSSETVLENQLDGLSAAIHGLRQALNNQDGVRLADANALFASDSPRFNLRQDYVNTIKNCYDGNVDKIDFSNPITYKVINDWVASKTENLIPDLFAPGALDPNTLLVLINALYFKGTWKYKFDQANTQPGRFQISQNKFVDNVKFMKIASAPFEAELQRNNRAGKKKFLHYLDSKWQIVGLPYAGEQSDVIAYFALPRSVSGDGSEFVSLRNVNNPLDEVLSRIGSAGLEEFEEIKLPKFDVESDISLPDVFPTLGLGELFGVPVDYSGIADGLLLSDGIHRAVIRVDEEGTEAAAVTALLLARGAVQRKLASFVADRPFLFVVQHKRSGAILFAGAIEKI